MSIGDLYQSGEHRKNVAHFAAIVNLASVDGVINLQEEETVKKYAKKLGISSSEYDLVIENPSKYPINPPANAERRMERIFDLFKIVYADNAIVDEECSLLEKYAVGLGYTSEQWGVLVKKSTKLFNGNIDFEDYRYIMDRK